MVRQIRKRRLWPCIVLAGLASCAAPPAAPIRQPSAPAPVAALPAPPSKPTQYGKASYYGPGLKGNETASGEKMDPNKLTAASKTLPLGSTAKVTNLDNSRSVDVTINDRGPYVRGRVIDLSAKAAKAVDLKKSGTTDVAVTPDPVPSSGN